MRRALRRLRGGSGGVRRRRLGLRSREGCLSLIGRELRDGDARPLREGDDANEETRTGRRLTRSPARMQRASRSIASLRLKILSSVRASAISSSLCLYWRSEGSGPDRGSWDALAAALCGYVRTGRVRTRSMPWAIVHSGC